MSRAVLQLEREGWLGTHVAGQRRLRRGRRLLDGRGRDDWPPAYERGGIGRVGRAGRTKRTAPAGAIVQIRPAPSVGEALRFGLVGVFGRVEASPCKGIDGYAGCRLRVLLLEAGLCSAVVGTAQPPDPPYAGARVRQLTKLTALSFVN
jgi:hypothetical protein